MDRVDIGIILYDGFLGSGADDETEVAIGTSTKLAGYELIIFFSLLIKVLEVLVG